MENKGSAFEKETLIKNMQFISLAIPMILGICFCLYLFNFAMNVFEFNTLPQNMREDHITSLIFRKDSWHLPLTISTLFETPIALSLTDNIPFIVILLKILNINSIQYFGMWFLLSTILFVFFSYRICKDIFEDNHHLILFGSLIFILMPFIWYHPLYVSWLSGFWVILWAYSIYFKRKPYTSTEWVGVLFFSALIHPYFVITNFLIMIADIIHLYIYNHKISSLRAVTSFSYLFTFTFFTLCLAGNFYLLSLPDQYYHSVPLSFNNQITSMYNPSYINIGKGIFIGFILSTVLAGIYSNKLKKYFHYYRALIGSLTVLLLLTLLGGIQFTKNTTIQLPQPFLKATVLPLIFTSEVKFIFPILFLVPIMINAMVLRLEKHRKYTGLLFLMFILTIEILSSKQFIIKYPDNSKISLDSYTMSFLQNAEKINWIFIDNIPYRPHNFDILGYYAFLNNKKINAAPVIRYPANYQEYHTKLKQMFLAQIFENNVVYVISKESFLQEFKNLGHTLELNNSILFKPYPTGGV